MSLLMEALKKAEEAKRLTGDGRTQDARASSPLPDLALHLDAIDSELASASKRPAEPDSRPMQAEKEIVETDLARRTANTLFTAKQTDSTKHRLLPVLALALLVAFGVGGYFWWQLNSLPTQTLAAPPTPHPLPAATNTKPEPEYNAPASLARNDTTAATEARPAPAAPSTAPVARASAKAPASSPVPPSPEKEKRADSSSTTPAIRLTRTPPRVNPQLEHAYAALSAGRMDEAQAGYEQVLRSDAKNIDALLGLATIASQRGLQERAHAFYTLALESDPTNPTARAGVAGAQGLANAEATESRLKTALSEQPESSPLLFALGSLYARQARWSEAQQAYFQAYAADPENPDFIFNVAVSLDHLRKSKLAAQYYQMALAAGESRAAGFDRDQVRNRLAELQP